MRGRAAIQTFGIMRFYETPYDSQEILSIMRRVNLTDISGKKFFYIVFRACPFYPSLDTHWGSLNVRPPC